MGLYKNTNGVLSPIAGRGKAEYGASTVRKGTITFTAASAQWNRVNVTFDEPMPDDDYLIDFIITSDEPSMGNITPYMVPTKTASGFTFKMYCSASQGITIAYTAFKLYTDNEYNGLLNNQRYSTDEIDTGKTWIDGKKIYRKVVDCGAGPEAGVTKTVNHNIANIERFTHLEMIGDNNANYWPVPWFDNSRKWYWYASRTAIFIASGASSDATNYNHLAILEYTKTTD